MHQVFVHGHELRFIALRKLNAFLGSPRVYVPADSPLPENNYQPVFSSAF